MLTEYLEKPIWIRSRDFRDISRIAADWPRKGEKNMSHIQCDEKLCTGCLACVTACLDQHYSETDADAISPRLYEKRKSKHSDMMCYKTFSCHHCESAPCVKACPTKALYKDENGFVAVRQKACIRCHACEKACPFDIPRFDKRDRIVKCDGCTTRVSCGLEPACVRVCPNGALKINSCQGELSD